MIDESVSVKDLKEIMATIKIMALHCMTIMPDEKGIEETKTFADNILNGIKTFNKEKELYGYTDDDIIRLQDVNKNIVVKQANKEELKNTLKKWDIPETEENFRIFSKVNLLEGLQQNDNFTEFLKNNKSTCKTVECTGDIWNYQMACRMICVTKDLSMGAGLAKELKEKYPEICNCSFDEEKRAFYTNNKDYPFILLGTKETAKEPATYDNLMHSLMDAKEIIEQNNIKSILVPHIGCKHDKMDWNIVRFIILQAFSDLPITLYFIKKEKQKTSLSY